LNSYAVGRPSSGNTSLLNLYALDLTESDNYTADKCQALTSYCSDSMSGMENGCMNIMDTDAWDTLVHTSCTSGGTYYNQNESSLNDYINDIEMPNNVVMDGSEVINFVTNWTPPATSTEEY